MITALCRTVILYFLIMIGLRLMGKRQIGELEPSELVLTMMISDLATVPMQDFGIPLLAGVIPILILLSLTLLMSQLSLLNLRFRALMCGTPAILIRNGKLQQAAMRKNRYTLDELLEQLRGQGCLSVEEVQYAVLENSGQLSVLPWAKAKPPTAEDLGLTLEEDTLPTVLINDGRVLRNNLRLCGRDEVWLQKILKQEHCTTKEVFLLTVDENGKRSAFPRRLTHETDAAAADFRVGGPVGVFPVEYPPHGRRNGPLAGTAASGGPAGPLRGVGRGAGRPLGKLR